MLFRCKIPSLELGYNINGRKLIQSYNERKLQQGVKLFPPPSFILSQLLRPIRLLCKRELMIINYYAVQW